MYCTLADLLENDILPHAQLLTDLGDFSKIIVESVSVQEFPLDNFIQENELVLSTAVGCEQEPTRYLQLIEEARQSHAAAIAFAFQGKGQAILPEILAEVHDFPLFQIPWECRFSAIQVAVLDTIRKKRVTVFREVQNKLFNLFFEAQSLDQAARLIAQELEVEIAILDRNGRQRGASQPEGNPPYGPTLTVEIQFSDMMFGRLLIWQPGGELEENRPLFEQYVAFPLALWFNKKNIEDLTITRLKNDFVHDLATGNYTSFAEMVRQGANLHFDLTRPYTCLVLRAALRGQNGSPVEYSDRTVRYASEIEKILLREASNQGMKVMVGNLNLEFVVFLENLSSNPQREVDRYLTNADNSIGECFPSLVLLWGCSEIVLEAPDFTRLYRNAILALQYCAADKSGSRRFTYKDTRKALIISVLSEHPQVQKNAQQVLGKLMEYDRHSSMDLLETLTKYIANNYNISQAARDLHICRQSLLYRLDKIQQLTGMSLDDHEDLFVLEVLSRIQVSY